jgi:TetR/AcrR family transcriptional repressor of nem operon
MARSKAFSPEEVLESALQLFWTKGYEQTTMQDLVDAMGINRGSLYDTFGDKRQLYRQAMERYLDWYTLRDLRLAMDSGDYSPATQISLLFDRLAEEGEGVNRRRGCLLTNTITELGHRDPEITEQVAAGVRRVEDTLTELIQKGQELGEFTSTEDARALAQFLTNTIQGMRVLTRVYGDRRHLADISRIALSTLTPKAGLH